MYIDTDTRYNAWLRLQHSFTSQKQLDNDPASRHQTCYDPSQGSRKMKFIGGGEQPYMVMVELTTYYIFISAF